MASSGISREVCLLFGRAMLWRIFDTCGDSLVPNEQKARIKAAYGDIQHNTLEPGTNPIKKVPLVIGGLDTEVIIETLEPGPNDGTATEPARATRDQRMALLTSQVHSLRRDFRDSCAQNDRQFQVSTSFCMDSFVHHLIIILSFLQMLRMQLRRLNKNVTKFMSRPAHIVGRRVAPQLNPTAVAEIQGSPDALEQDAMELEADQPEPPRPLIARLSKCPKTLNDLWAEYEFGVGGYKPAKLYTAQERGAVKDLYYRRNNFWTIVAELVRAGESADTVIEKMYRIYGPSSSVTKILAAIKHDKKRGGHPDLRVRRL